MDDDNAKCSAGLPTPQLDSRLSFSSFAVSPVNQATVDAAKKLLERPDGIYNPLIICGDVGTGKTHLLHAIGNDYSWFEIIDPLCVQLMRHAVAEKKPPVVAMQVKSKSSYLCFL